MDAKRRRYVVMGAMALIAILVIGGIIWGVMSFLAPPRRTVSHSPIAQERQATSEPQAEQQAGQQAEQPAAATRDVTFQTEDGVRIVGTYYPGSGDGVLLLHQLGSDRHSWDYFAKKLQDAGYAVLSIDMRGHGESGLDWREFRSPTGVTRQADNDFLGMLLDVKAAKSRLNEEGKFASVIVGASIGANIAALYAETDSRVKEMVLLSPGMDYRGVQLPSGPLFAGKTMLVASSDDKQSAAALDAYPGRIRGEHKTLEYPGKAHGTEILDTQPGLADRIIEWLKK